MSMTAEILAIGKFSQSIADCLDYSADFYEDVPEGTIVVSRCLPCNGKTGSEFLADSVGVDPRDFATHPIKKRSIRWDHLKMEFNHEDVDQLKRLADAGFALIYLPNY